MAGSNVTSDAAARSASRAGTAADVEVVTGADGLGGVDGPASLEHRQPAQESLGGGSEEFVAPADGGVEAAMPARRSVALTAEPGRSSPSAIRSSGSSRGPGGGELDPQGQAVDGGTDARHGPRRSGPVRRSVTPVVAARSRNRRVAA